jgi:predicted helicase
VLYVPTYREKYAEFLRMDFPLIPFTSDGELFLNLAKLGERLMGLHLLKSDELDPPACRFDGDGDERVDKGKKEGLRYDPDKQRAHINATQYFAPVPEAVSTYRIGDQVFVKGWKNGPCP